MLLDQEPSGAEDVGGRRCRIETDSSAQSATGRLLYLIDTHALPSTPADASLTKKPNIRTGTIIHSLATQAGTFGLRQWRHGHAPGRYRPGRSQSRCSHRSSLRRGHSWRHDARHCSLLNLPRRWLALGLLSLRARLSNVRFWHDCPRAVRRGASSRSIARREQTETAE